MERLVRKYHRWLVVFVGIQFAVWSASGLYMVSTDIHFIHGESLQNEQKPALILSDVNYSMNELLARFPNAQNVRLTQVLDKTVYQFVTISDAPLTHLLDASTGQEIRPISKQQAVKIAQDYIAKEADVASVVLHTERAPAELSTRHLPAWQVTFSDASQATFYIKQTTGSIVTKRHFFWRMFDWMWRLHIMDYDDGENIANYFLLLMTLLSIITALTGMALLYYRLLISPNKKSARQLTVER